MQCVPGRHNSRPSATASTATAQHSQRCMHCMPGSLLQQLSIVARCSCAAGRVHAGRRGVREQAAASARLVAVCCFGLVWVVPLLVGAGAGLHGEPGFCFPVGFPLFLCLRLIGGTRGGMGVCFFRQQGHQRLPVVQRSWGCFCPPCLVDSLCHQQRVCCCRCNSRRVQQALCLFAGPPHSSLPSAPYHYA